MKQIYRGVCTHCSCQLHNNKVPAISKKDGLHICIDCHTNELFNEFFKVWDASVVNNRRLKNVRR